MAYGYRREMLPRAEQASARSLQTLRWQRRLSGGFPLAIAPHVALLVAQALLVTRQKIRNA